MDHETDKKTFFDQVARDAAQSPMTELMHLIFINERDIIYQMRAGRPTDELLCEFISDRFGILTGRSIKNGWCEYAGGSSPRLDLKDENFNVICRLEGLQLVRAFRSLYRMQSDGQLSLF